MPSGSIFVGLLWGALVGALGPYLLANEEVIRAAGPAAIETLDLPLLGALAFVALSIFFILVLLLVGLFSSIRRKDFLSTVLGFGLGLGIGPFAMDYAQQQGWVTLPGEAPVTEAAPEAAAPES
ncbi:MAG: hypothetical protein AAF919_15915 [Pseudomonadota bacterium]